MNIVNNFECKSDIFCNEQDAKSTLGIFLPEIIINSDYLVNPI